MVLGKVSSGGGAWLATSHFKLEILAPENSGSWQFCPHILLFRPWVHLEFFPLCFQGLVKGGSENEGRGEEGERCCISTAPETTALPPLEDSQFLPAAPLGGSEQVLMLLVPAPYGAQEVSRRRTMDCTNLHLPPLLEKVSCPQQANPVSPCSLISFLSVTEKRMPTSPIPLPPGGATRRVFT